MLTIRTAVEADEDAVWRIIEPVIRAGETYALPRDLDRESALQFWFAARHEVFVAIAGDQPVGTYFLRPNHGGGGSHVANAGYITAEDQQHRGVGRAMCAHSIEQARTRGFRAIQFNIVVSTNERAVKLWQSFGFEILGRLPQAFWHPRLGYVDVFVMYLQLER